MERFYIRNARTNVNGNICLTILGTGGDAKTIQTTTYWYGSKQYDTIRSCDAKDGQPYTYWIPNKIPLDVMVRLEVRIDRGDPVNIYLYQPKQATVSNNPTAGTLNPLSYHSATQLGWMWSGFKAVGSGYTYEYSLEKEGASQPEWSSYNGEQLIFKGLKPETTYTFRLRMKDSRGYYSDVLCSTETTDIDQTRVGFNDGGSFKRARVWVNVDGKMKKVKRIYHNVDGSIKLIKSL